MLTSLVSLLLFGTIPFQTLIDLMNANKVFLRLDESGFTISHVGRCETVQWDWVERFMVVRGARSRRWVGWRYAAHYPPPHRRRRSTRYLVADEVLPSLYDVRPEELTDLLNSLHAEFRSAVPQQPIVRPALAQMLSDAAQLPMMLYPNKQSLLSTLIAIAVLGASAVYLLSARPIILSIIVFILVLVAVRIMQEMRNGTTYLRLDEEGFTHHTLQSEQFVRWQEVERFVVSDYSEFVGWRYVPESASNRRKVVAFQTAKLDDVLMRVYGDRPEDLASLLNYILEAKTQKEAIAPEP